MAFSKGNRDKSSLASSHSRLYGLIVFSSLISLLTVPSVQVFAQSNAASPVGTNLADVTWYTTEQPFLNIFKTGGGWTTVAMVNGSNMDTGEEDLLYSSFLDANGYPTTLTAGPAHTFNRVSTLVLSSLGAPYYPSGRYVLRYDGTGTFTYLSDAVRNGAISSPGRDVLDVTPSNNGISITLQTTDPNNTGDYVRNIRLVYAPTATSSVIDPNETSTENFNPDFINRIAPFRELQFMKWISTYTNPVVNWADRAQANWVFWDEGTAGNQRATAPKNVGVPVEVQIALCNEIGADCWFNMPLLSSDDYINQFATLAHSTLNSNLKAYVEFGNEMWAAQGYEPWLTFASEGHTNIPGSYDDNQVVHGYGVVRAVQAGAIWKGAWGADSGRVVRVYADISANNGNLVVALPYTASSLGYIGPNPWSGTVAQNVDAVAVAPYFGYAVPDTLTLDQLFTEIMTGGVVAGGYPGGMIKEALDWAAANYATVNSFGLPLISYEGGQSLVDYTYSDTALQNLYAAANRDPRMGTAYVTLLNGWESLGGTLFNNYADVTPYNMWGYWGLLENVLQTSSAKYTALTNYISATPCWWSGCSSTTTSSSTASHRQPVTTPSPPTVSISSPKNGTTIKGNGSVNIVSSASDANSINSITIMGDNSVLLTCSNTTSCSATWQGNNISNGTHVISVTASDQFGLQASSSITILALK